MDAIQFILKELDTEETPPKRIMIDVLTLRESTAKHAALIAERDALKRLLKEIEYGGTVDGYSACPVCLQDEFKTHTTDCKLAIALAEAK